MKHLFILLFLCQGILAQAQTRLSKMPWHERDSVITARMRDYFHDSNIGKEAVALIYQNDFDESYVEWLYNFLHPKEKDSIERAFAPSDRYIYHIDIIGKEYYPFDFDNTEPEIGRPATAMMEENFNVLLSEYTYDVTVYGNGFDMKDKIPTSEIFRNAPRHPKKYEIPTDGQLRGKKYAYGKSVASLKKAERIRILTGIALNHLVYHTKKGECWTDMRDVGEIYPTISEGTFKFLKYDWIPEKYRAFKKDEIPEGTLPEDIYHCITIYWEGWEKAGLKSPVLASCWIADKNRKVIRCRMHKPETRKVNVPL